MEESNEGKKKAGTSIPLWLALALAALVCGGVYLYQYRDPKTKLVERLTVATIHVYIESQELYRRTDWDGDGVLEYAHSVTGDNSLYETRRGLGDLQYMRKEGATAFDLDRPHESPKGRPCYARILTSQGEHAPGGAKDYLENGNMTKGYAVVTWPTQYGTNGTRTFVANQLGVIYAKDLGPDTDAIARAMTAFDPDNTWSIIVE